MHLFIKIENLTVDAACISKLKKRYEKYIRHNFDLLGSGDVKVDYQLKAKGLFGHKYIDYGMERYGKIVKDKLKKKCNTSYEPINWFVDYKSGFFFHPWRYSSVEKCNRTICKYAGMDIKCPWELGRFYHLVQMAVLAVAEIKYREKIIDEFIDELTDFIEINPIGKTVQWSAPMDVSIRIVNLLISFDMLYQLDEGRKLNKAFQEKFEKHIYYSLKYLMKHLECEDGMGSNHYLSNLAGIIFAGAYLRSDKWTDACLVFGLQELIDQVYKQFYEEGGHFEGSTSYHRLSTEFVIYSTAIIYGVLKTERKKVFGDYEDYVIAGLKTPKRQKYNIKSEEFFPRWYIERVFNMGIFTKHILKNNNEITQIGDNDSGRLIKLTPMGEGERENVIDHRTLLSAMNGLFTEDGFIKYGNEIPLEASLIQSMTGGMVLKGKIFDVQVRKYGTEIGIDSIYSFKKETVIYNDNINSDLRKGIKIFYYTKFGIVILRGDRLFLSLVLDTAKEAKYTGHTHNDKLSIEVMVDNKYITRDIGGYIYTAAPKIRDRFRSVKAHNTIHIKGYEQNIFNGIWDIKKRSKVELIYCDDKKIVAKTSYADVLHIRVIDLSDDRIVVKDYANRPFTVSFKNRIISTGYGELEGDRDDSK